MLLNVGNGLELEFVAYQGDVEWGKDIEGVLPHLSIHPRQPANFVIGLIREPFRYGQQPLPLEDWEIRGQIQIDQVKDAWLGVTYQLVNDQLYYEAVEIFAARGYYAWLGGGTEDFPMANYLMRTASNLKSQGCWVAFAVSLTRLLEGWVGTSLVPWSNGSVSLAMYSPEGEPLSASMDCY